MNKNTLIIVPSHLKNKKFDAIFEIDNYGPLIIPFGAKGYSDFTSNHSEKKRMMYINCHQKREDWNYPYSAGALSRWILWETDDLNLNIALFKKRFGFQ